MNGWVSAEVNEEVDVKVGEEMGAQMCKDE